MHVRHAYKQYNEILGDQTNLPRSKDVAVAYFRDTLLFLKKPVVVEEKLRAPAP